MKNVSESRVISFSLPTLTRKSTRNDEEKAEEMICDSFLFAGTSVSLSSGREEKFVASD